MGSILDYVHWRGDLSFEQDGFGAQDALVISAVSYLELDQIVPQDMNDAITVRDAQEEFQSRLDDPKYREIGRIFQAKEFIGLFAAMAESRRYGDLKMSGYVNHVDEQSEEQFAAIVFSREKEQYVVFRGTDDTLIGWKEDFNIAYMDVIPAQETAVLYLNRVFETLKGKVYTMGHSKGGNLAVYSAVRSKNRFKKRLAGVYNFDGPGFSEEFLTLGEYQLLNPVCRWYLPNESMIGTLLFHGSNEYVMRSTNKGILQHDPFSWEVLGKEFVLEESLSKEAVIAHLAIDDCMKKLTVDQRKQFVSIIFDSLFSTEAKTLSDIKLKNVLEMVDKIHNLDAESRKILSDMYRLVLKTVRENR